MWRERVLTEAIIVTVALWLLWQGFGILWRLLR